MNISKEYIKRILKKKKMKSQKEIKSKLKCQGKSLDNVNQGYPEHHRRVQVNR